MIYNTIMVQLDIDAPAAPRLTFAWDLARRFEARLIAFAASDPYLVIPGDLDGGAAAEAMRRQREDIGERLKALKSEFDGLTGDSERSSWRGMVGDPTRLLALNARAADLIVTGQPGSTDADRLRTIEPGELILSAGRPVLFAGEDLRPLTAENVLVAWKDTREARRAVVDALPFLLHARQVLVATVPEGDRADAQEGVADTVRFLMRHGVKARSEVLDDSSVGTTEALLRAAAENDADLIVSGGYGHSRFREWVFGGVTRSLLRDGPMHRLIAS